MSEKSDICWCLFHGKYKERRGGSRTRISAYLYSVNIFKSPFKTIAFCLIWLSLIGISRPSSRKLPDVGSVHRNVAAGFSRSPP